MAISMRGAVIRTIPAIGLVACGITSTGTSALPSPLASDPPPTVKVPPASTTSDITAPASIPRDTIPRDRTLKLAGLVRSPIGVTNPWCSLGYTHTEGNSLLWEGLSYYGVLTDHEIPWLADRMTYNNDNTELTITLNPHARWSDGQPVTADDVAFTFDGQMQDEALPYHTVFAQYVSSYEISDNQTIVLRFKMPAPRFKFEVLTLKFDTGIPILPAHALRPQADIHAYAGGASLPHSGPYNLVAWDVAQKVFDRRPNWWAVDAGLAPLPAVERVVFEGIVQPMDTIAQRVVNNEFDATLLMTGPLIASVIHNNARITSYSGDQPPYGFLDWWASALWMNTQVTPYDDPRVRRALSLAIDRDRLNQLLYGGSPIATIYPFPLYPALTRFADSPAVVMLETRHAPGAFDLVESARLMTTAGFSKNADGFWSKNGQVVNAQVNGFDSVHNDVAPVLAEMLLQAGFESSPYLGSDVYSRMAAGADGLFLYGHGASLVDPYAVFEMFHSRHRPPEGQPADVDFARYSDPAYDRIVDAMATLPADDPEFQELAAQALDIYWRDVITIPVMQWLNRIPYNQTYWTHWPTQNDPGPGVTGGFWSQTAPLMIAHLKPAP